MADMVFRPRVFLDIQIGTQPAGRIIIELFVDKTPKTCENFRAISTSSYCPASSMTPLTYRLTPFHRVIDEFMIQGGDISAGDGTGGQSIYGGEFGDENIGWREIDVEGLVCMANRGKGTNGSQFFITIAPCQHLNVKHTVFGQVVSGMDTVHKMAKVKVDKSDRPLVEVLISNCGELEQRNKLFHTARSARKNVDHHADGHSSDRGRKRPMRALSPAESQSSSESGRQKKHYKLSRRLDSPQARRRSDINIDETRRGRELTRSPSPTLGRAKARYGFPHDQHRRRRSASPSRPRDVCLSPSPHLRREHTRSRPRSPEYRWSKGHNAKLFYRVDEEDIRREEREREGGTNRFEDVIDDEHECRQDSRQIRGSSYNPPKRALRYDDVHLGESGETDAGGQVKFKGRGSMKYRERQW